MILIQGLKDCRTKLYTAVFLKLAFQVALVVKNLPDNAGDLRDAGLIPGLGRSSGVGRGTALQYSSLRIPVGRGTRQAILPSIAQSQTLKRLSMQQICVTVWC